MGSGGPRLLLPFLAVAVVDLAEHGPQAHIMVFVDASYVVQGISSRYEKGEGSLA